LTAVAETIDVLASVEAALRLAFATDPTRASTSFVGVEPIEVLRFVSADVVSYVTLGMSRHPMTASDAQLANMDGPRAELLIQARGDGGEIWRRLAVLAAAPAVESVVFIEGMTVDLGVGLNGLSACTGGLVVASALAPVPTAAGEVRVLRILPATSSELAWSRVHGSAALQTRWESHGTDLLDLARSGVDLS
jgi:hypothetical protein